MPDRIPIIKTPEPEINQTFDYIRNFWASLTEPGDSLALSLAGRFVRPGGFFKNFFYWDSYFTILGLVVQDKWQLAREVLDNLIYEVEQLGFVPNYNGYTTICNSRSQPPLLTAAIYELYPYVNDKSWLERAVEAASKEYHHYWMKKPHLTDTGLSRYIDLGNNGCTTVPDTPHHRGIAESGWDNTPRFGDDITRILPVDLNCLLYRYERDLDLFWKILGNNDKAQEWKTRAEKRMTLINEYFWDEESSFYWDYNLQTENRVQELPRSLSSFVPLWAEVSTKDQAKQLVEHLSIFEADFGLVTCEDGWADNTQWNYPVGWAPLHWFVAYGLRLYGYDHKATEITMKWLRLLARKYTETGVLREKYNVVDPEARLPGRYGPQRGFGWTNGVFAALLIRVIFGLDFDLAGLKPRWTPILPVEWQNKEFQLVLPNYPWPNGSILP
ncbi:MAG: trehalase family glycosidase [Promethearchaeota archaeon]